MMTRRLNTLNWIFIVTSALYLGSCGGSGGSQAERVFGIEGSDYCDAMNRALEDAMSNHLTVDQASKAKLYERAVLITASSKPGIADDAPLTAMYSKDEIQRIRGKIFRDGEGTDVTRMDTCDDLATLQSIWNKSSGYSGLSSESLDSEQASTNSASLPELDAEATLIKSSIQSQIRAGENISTAVFPIFMNAFLRSMDLFSRYENSKAGKNFEYGIRFYNQAEASYDRKISKSVVVDSVRSMEKSLQPGDQVTAIRKDGVWTDVNNMKVSDFEEFFEFNPAQTAVVKVNRKDAAGKLEVKEVTIEGSPNRAYGGSHPSVSGELVGDIIYVKLYEFDSGAGQQVSDEISSLLTQWAIKQTSKGVAIADTSKPTIIFDLRFNPGGSVDEALTILGLFLPYQKLGTFVYRSQEIDLYPNVTRVRFSNPLFVLVNHGSASASELVTQILQESGRALVVGERTFGKGIGQQGYEMGVGSSIEGRIWITTSRFLGPTGKNIQLVGITPDLELKDSQLEGWFKEATSNCEKLTRDNFRRCIQRMEDFKKIEDIGDRVLKNRDLNYSVAKTGENTIKSKVSQLRTQVKTAEEAAKAQAQGLPDELKLVIDRDEVTREVSKIANQLMKP